MPFTRFETGDRTCLLELLLKEMGRPDIGIGELVEDGHRVLMTLHKGRFAYRTYLPAAAFLDRRHVKARLSATILTFNRALRIAGPSDRSPVIIRSRDGTRVESSASSASGGLGG